MMLKVTLYGKPNDVTATVLQMRELLNVLGESQDEPHQSSGWVRRYLDVSLRTKLGNDSLSLIPGWETSRTIIQAIYSLIPHSPSSCSCEGIFQENQEGEQ